MEAEDDMRDDSIRLSSGRTIRPNRGIVGISLTLDKEPIADGYDSHVFMDDEEKPWTKEEKLELAERMIARWRWWADQV